MPDLKYNFVGDNFFTTYQNAPDTIVRLPLGDIDIGDWGYVGDNGVIYTNNNDVKKSENPRMILNNNEEVLLNSPSDDLLEYTSDYSGPIRISKSSQKENAIYIMNSLINKGGFKPHQAAGIVGNLMVESGLNTGSYNPNDVGLPGGGLAGWRGSNFSKLKTFANNLGKSWKDIDSQLDFLTSSINTDVMLRLTESTNPHQASEAWAYYEKYAGYDGTTKTAKKAGWSLKRVDAEHKNRSDYANEIYKLWK